MAATFDTFFPFAAQTVSNAQWQSYIQMFRGDGVVTQLGGTASLAVVQHAAGADRSVDVSAGRLLCQGIFGENSTVKNLPIAVNGSGNPRIDTIVARIVQATPTVVLDVLQGTPGAVPVAPTLTQTASVYEVPLANLAVANAFASIVTANITDQRAWAGPAATRLPAAASAAALNYNVYANAPNIVCLPVTGTTTITSIPAAPAGSILILEFGSTCQVTAGANLKMFRNFTGYGGGAGGPGTLTLYSDGTSWLEIGRASEEAPAHTYFGNSSASLAPATFNSIVAADLPLFSLWTLTSIVQNAVSLSFTPTYARIAQFGKAALVLGAWTINQVGTAANIISINVPAALTPAAAMTAFSCLGQFTYIRISGPIWTGSIEVNTATNWFFLAGGGLTQIGASPSFATANGDVLSICAMYELA